MIMETFTSVNEQIIPINISTKIDIGPMEDAILGQVDLLKMGYTISE